MAFDYIWLGHVIPRTLLRAIVERYCQKRNEPIEAVTFSWKRPGVDYSSVWLYRYNVVSRRLSAHSRPLTDAITKAHIFLNMHSLYLEQLLSCCGWVRIQFDPDSFSIFEGTYLTR